MEIIKIIARITGDDASAAKDRRYLLSVFRAMDAYGDNRGIISCKTEYTRKERIAAKRTDVLNCGYTFLSIHVIIFGDL